MVVSRFLTRPENAHKKAQELIAIGRKQQALEALLEVFRNKKWMYHWTETVLEPIITLILNLCIDLKRPYVAKEIFYQYRNQVQNVNINSLEKVIRDYLKKAEQCTENAKDKSIQAVTDVDDLDNITTPESIMLSTVSGEDAQDRSDRTILTPWVKFLWESYCQLLELLRTNMHVEHLYHDIAKMAFQFCVRYARKTEFRKLCDKLRKHLEDINKPPVQPINVCITKPETQQYNLDTRLSLLDCAIQMELWQEAFRAIEDINGLMVMSKKTPLPKTMANFYQKQAMVFWKSGNYLFHAAALFKLFQLSKDMKKNISQEEVQKMACRVLVAVLSIPMPSAHPEFDRFIETDKSALEKNQRLAVLLGLQYTPTRTSLVRDLVRSNIISLTVTELQNLYEWLEVDFDPLSLCERITTVIEYLKLDENSSLQQYIPALQDVALMRLVRQVAQVYQSIEYSRLLSLSKFCDQFRLERLLVDSVRHNDMQIRIDHGKQCIYFGIDLSESQREERPDGPTLQCMPSEQIRNQLINMHKVLSDSINIIDPNFRKNKRKAIREKLVNYYLDVKDEDHQRILQRHQIIEDRKEYIERMNYAREEEEQRRVEELQRQQMLAEQKRLEIEREERERKKQLNELQSIEEKRKRDKVQQILQTTLGQKVFGKLDEKELSKLDTEQIAAREAEEIQKERREIQVKLKSQEKRFDYFERAKRLEEISLMEKYIAEKQKIDKAYWDEQEDERVNKIIDKHDMLLATKDRFQKLIGDKEQFLEQVLRKRKEKFVEDSKKFDEVCKVERLKLLIERKAKRKEQRKQDWLDARQRELDRQQEEQKRKLEEEKRRKDEAERKEREEREKLLRAEREKQEREQAEMLERQRRKQLEIEEKAEQTIREEKERALKASGLSIHKTSATSNVWKSDVKTGDSWRNISTPSVTGATSSAVANSSDRRYEPPMRNRGLMESTNRQPSSMLNNRSDRDFPKFEKDLSWKRDDKKQSTNKSAGTDSWRRNTDLNSDVNKSGANMFQNLDKTTVLQDTRMFNVTTINVKKCNLVVTKILYLINQGEQLSTKEATDAFFNMTKSFQSNDVMLRRMVYLAIKELCSMADDVIIVTSSLTKDMTGKEDLFRAAAIRALCSITDASMLQAIERYMRQAIVDKNSAVSSAALVSSIHLFQCTGTADVIKRWANEIQEAVNSDNVMVQYHALGILYQIRRMDRLAVIKLVTKLTRRNIKSPYAACLLIRISSKLLEESEVPDAQLLEFIEISLRHKSEMVVYEAANAIVNMRWTTSRELAPALNVLQQFCSSSKATVRFAAVRTLNKIATSYPNAVAACNVDIENLITDSNRSVATLAITTLLKTGAESSVERLMKQISTFMAEITDEFKIVVIASIKALSLKYPAKTQTLMTYLSSMLRDEGGLEFKVAIAEAIITLIDENSEASEIGLSHLCEFIEDCEHSSLAIRVLHLLGREGPKSQNPHRYIRYIYNRVILEQPQIRVAAVSALAQIAASCVDLRDQILVLLKRCHYDSNCDVRDLAVFYTQVLNSPNKSLSETFITEPMQISILGLERALVEYLMKNDSSKPFNLNSVPIIDPKIEPNSKIYNGNIDDLSKVLQQNHAVQKPTSFITDGIDKQKLLNDRSFIEKLAELVPDIEEELGPLMKSSDLIALTEQETEYSINLIKHCYGQHVVLQFHCMNTLNDQLLENVTIWLDLPEGFECIKQLSLDSLPYGEVGSGSVYVVLKLPRNLDDCIASISGVLKFMVKDCDPITGEPDSDQGYNDEYRFEDFEISLADQMVPVPKMNFWQSWNDLNDNDDYIEMEETYALSSMKTLEDAVSNIIKFLGLMPAERSDKLSDSKTTHTLLLSGQFRGGYEVLICAKLAVSETTGTTMKLIVRAANQQVTELIISSVG